MGEMHQNHPVHECATVKAICVERQEMGRSMDLSYLEKLPLETDRSAV